MYTYTHTHTCMWIHTYTHTLHPTPSPLIVSIFFFLFLAPFVFENFHPPSSACRPAPSAEALLSPLPELLQDLQDPCRAGFVRGGHTACGKRCPKPLTLNP